MTLPLAGQEPQYEACFAPRDFVYQFDADKQLLGWRFYDVVRDKAMRPMTFVRVGVARGWASHEPELLSEGPE